MSRAAPASNPTDLTDRQLAQLARLAEIGMEIAEAAGRQARGEGEGAGADAALGFSRAARAVRLTIALETRLVAERAASERGEAAVRASEADRRRDRIHDKVDRLIDEVAQTERADAEAAERLSEAVWERLTETEDEALLDRPTEEIVARICADLGLAPGWAGDAFGAGVIPDSGALHRPLAPSVGFAATSPAPQGRRGTGIPCSPVPKRTAGLSGEAGADAPAGGSWSPQATEGAPLAPQPTTG